MWIGIMVSEFLVPNGTHYVMNVAWCGCTIFDQIVPEGIHFMGVASFSPIKMTISDGIYIVLWVWLQTKCT